LGNYALFPCYDMSGPEWAFRSVTRTHRLAISAVLQKMGLREIRQPMLLFILNDMRLANRTCSQKDLCDILQRSAPTVTISLKSLEKRGYVQRVTDIQDRRRNCITLTPVGIEISERCLRAFADVDNAMYAGFSVAERQHLTEIFNRITDNLSPLFKNPAKEAVSQC